MHFPRPFPLSALQEAATPVPEGGPRSGPARLWKYLKILQNWEEPYVNVKYPVDPDLKLLMAVVYVVKNSGLVASVTKLMLIFYGDIKVQHVDFTRNSQMCKMVYPNRIS